ncbi:MAG: hypothetical protein AAF702_44500 [Chloroflexota bacterium]
MSKLPILIDTLGELPQGHHILSVAVDEELYTNWEFWPNRLVAFFRRIKGLRQGQYAILLNVKKDRELAWRLAELGESEG